MPAAAAGGATHARRRVDAKVAGHTVNVLDNKEACCDTEYFSTLFAAECHSNLEHETNGYITNLAFRSVGIGPEIKIDEKIRSVYKIDLSDVKDMIAKTIQKAMLPLANEMGIEAGEGLKGTIPELINHLIGAALPKGQGLVCPNAGYSGDLEVDGLSTVYV